VSAGKFSRRDWLRLASRVAVGAPLGFTALSKLRGTEIRQGSGPRSSQAPPPAAEGLHSLLSGDPTRYRFTPQEDSFLEELELACFQFFRDEANPATGLVKDRSQASGSDTRNVGSIASTGFGLTALCIADRRGWMDSTKIHDRVATTLRFVESRLPQVHGFFFHFQNIENGERAFQSEVSSIDTAILVCGVLTCGAYFQDAKIQALAKRIYERMDWSWMLQGDKTLSMGWTPEQGFIHSRWDSYSELMMMYLLGLGSSPTAMSRQNWDAWKRPCFEFRGVRYIGSYAPLFVHQYSHAWFDFRGQRDEYANYFTNSMIATKVHKLWCLELSNKFPDYGEDMWGITASDSARGYTAWGGPPPMGHIDGSIVPCAAGGSLPFLPEETVRVLINIRRKYEKRAWNKYGFADAFNPLTNWYNPDVIGIDVGIILLMAENARTGFVWQQFMKNEVARNGMARAGFHAVTPAEAAAPPKLPAGEPVLKIE
jgi:hypothetical protein